MSENIWFTSDLHLGHKNIIEFCKDTRPGTTIDEHDSILVDRWNSVVKDSDVVYILGDECLGDRDSGYNHIKKLNGIKHLIRGNHTVLKKQEHRDIFESISDIKEITIKLRSGKKQKIVMCHFPILVWNGMHYGSWLLFGHCHGSLQFDLGKAMDVGIDNNPNFIPFSLVDIENNMLNREIRVWDHHD